MKNKQTAVEWLAEQIKFTNKEMYAELQEVIEQAKQMEKEQMIEFADKYGFDVCHFDYDRAEQYYNETYGNQDNG
jgi:hypothetical protein